MTLDERTQEFGIRAALPVFVADAGGWGVAVMHLSCIFVGAVLHVQVPAGACTCTFGLTILTSLGAAMACPWDTLAYCH